MTAAQQNNRERTHHAEQSLEFAIEAARLCDDSKVAEIVVFDMRGISSLADYFVIGTGTSSRQMNAVLEQLKAYGKTVDRRPFRVTDVDSSTWLLADYVDVIVHLFDTEHREYYDLDGLWGDAPKIEWRRASSEENGNADTPDDE